jgi:copper(I)-binding protein
MKNTNFSKKAVLGALFSLASLSAFAGQAENIEVKNPFVREVPPTAMATAAFMTLENRSGHAIKLVKADSDASKLTQLHTHIHANGVMKMREVPNITVPANGEVALKPGSYHIMLINLNKPLKQGDKVKLTLTFEDGSHKTVYAPVKSMMMGGMHAMHGMHH